MKLPVSYTLGNREASLDKDALMRNALAEQDEAVEGLVRARKRPCLDSAFTATSGQGQQLLNWEVPGPVDPVVTLVVISDDTLITTPNPIQKSLAFTVEPS